MGAPRTDNVGTLSTKTVVPAVAVGIQALPANPQRLRLTIFNPSGGVGTLFVDYLAAGVPVAANCRFQILPGGFFEDSNWRGPVRFGLSVVGPRNIIVTEET